MLRLVDGTLLVAAQVASGTRVISPGDDAPPVEVPAGYDIAYIKIDPLSGAATTEIVDEGDADDTILASAPAADGTAWLAIAAGRTATAETSPVIPPTVFLRSLAADGSRLASVSYPIGDPRDAPGAHRAPVAVAGRARRPRAHASFAPVR